MYVEDIIINYEEYTVLINKEIFQKLLLKIDKKKENGGVLFGYKIRDKEEYIISDFTEPFSKDIRKYAYFERKDPLHMKTINDLWIVDKKVMYFGDWHSHPIGKAIPSNTDLESWKKISRNAETSSNILIFILLAPDNQKIWLYNKKGETICCNEIFPNKDC